MSYHGPATIVSDGKETPATVTLHVDTSQPIKSWDGTGTVEVSGIPDISVGMSVIRLPDGREGQALVSVRYNSSANQATLEINGSGEPPFDFGAATG